MLSVSYWWRSTGRTITGSDITAFDSTALAAKCSKRFMTLSCFFCDFSSSRTSGGMFCLTGAASKIALGRCLSRGMIGKQIFPNKSCMGRNQFSLVIYFHCFRITFDATSYPTYFTGTEYVFVLKRTVENAFTRTFIHFAVSKTYGGSLRRRCFSSQTFSYSCFLSADFMIFIF